ncbi:MAG: DoxX family protein [Candidatus Nanohaloarchaea archaeon]
MVLELTTQYAALGLATFRIILGSVFVKHAVPKLEDPESTREFFKSVGLPDSVFLVYLALAIEIVLGTMLAIGLYTQLAALFLTAFMVFVTYIAIVKMDKGFEGGYEVDLLLLGACFMYYLNGAGKYAVDALL